MGFINYCARSFSNFFGLKDNNSNSATSYERVDAGKRKRQDEEEEEEENYEASASVSSKNSLNTLPPYKRVKIDPSMSSKKSNSEAKSPVGKVISKIRSFFAASEPKSVQVQASEVATSNQAESVDQDALKSIETIDLVGKIPDSNIFFNI